MSEKTGELKGKAKAEGKIKDKTFSKK